jgi:cytochrome b561
MPQNDRHSAVAVINHWITALLVIAMLTLGLLARNAPNDGIEDYVMSAHIGLGFFTLLFVLWRVAWRLMEGFPDTVTGPGWQRVVARAVHIAILITITGLVLTGPLYLFTENEAIDVFGWFSVGLPLGGLEFLHEPAEAIHKFLAVPVVIVLLALHIAGGVVHILDHRSARTPADL